MSEVVNQSVAGISPTPSPKKVCIYFDIFSDEEKLFYERARQAEALDEEITMLRVRIYSMALHEPKNMTMLIRALLCLNQLCRTNTKNYKRDSFDLEKIQANTIAMLKGINVPVEYVEGKFH